MDRGLRLSEVPEELTTEEFWERFGRIEHEALDFKRGVPDDILDTIPCMAMTDGGLIVHGVDKELNILGCPLSQNTLDRITRFANECNVEVQVRAIQVGTRELTVTEVPESSRTHRYLTRRGGSCVALAVTASRCAVTCSRASCGSGKSDRVRRNRSRVE